MSEAKKKSIELDEQVMAQGRIIDGLKKKLEALAVAVRPFIGNKAFMEVEMSVGMDLDGDGKIGGRVRVGWLVTVAAMFATVTMAGVVVNWDNSSRTGDAKIEHDGTDYTLTVDKIVAESVTSSGTISGVPTTATNAAIATVTETETYGTLHKTVLTLASTPVVINGTAAGTNGFGSVKIYDFPQGRIAVIGVLVDGVTNTVGTGLDVADGGDFSLGSAAATLGDTLTGTEANFLQSTSIDPLPTKTDAALTATPTAQLDGTTTAAAMYYNIVVDDGDISAVVTNTVSADAITVWWINLGDY